MKNFEFNSFGMTEMTVQETRDTNGGSATVFLICAAVTLLLATCGENNTYNFSFFSNNSAGDADVTVGVKATGEGETAGE